MTYSKPAVRNAWADTAVPTTDIVDPGNAIVTEGWLQSTTPPARQYFNWVLNWSAAAIRYFCQTGISTWDSSETYQINAIVQSGGILYQSLQNSNTGNSPQANFGGAFWGALNNYAYYLSGSTNGGNFNLRNYVLTTALTSTLASYVTQTSLTSQLSNYVTNATLSSDLASYLTISSAAATYVSNSSLATTLTSYLTKALATSTYAPLISPGLSGVPTAPTAANGTETTQIATTAFATGTWTSNSLTGYQKFSSGVIFQWGIAVNGGSPQSVSFPIAFPHFCVSITATSTPSNGTISTSNPNSSTTGFTLTNGAAGVNTSWMAIGY